MEAATELGQPGSRREEAALVAHLGAIDAHSIAAVLSSVRIKSSDEELTVGWFSGSKGRYIAAVTYHHQGLVRLLLQAAAPHLQGW